MPCTRNRGQRLCAIDVHLGELDPPAERRHLTLEHRPQHTAGRAPLGPEVDHHRHGARPGKDGLFELRFGDVVDEGHARL